VVALVLMVVTAAAALILARLYHLGVAAILVGIILGVPSLYLGWVSVRDSQATSGPAELAGVADELAAAVREQWEKEAKVRGLNDPWPLPVSWVAADTSLADGWDLLVTLATSGAGWPPPPSAGTWAAAPDELAGDGNHLLNVLARVPTGRLVVLGEPGAGKTMLMVRLVLDLLARRASGSPVPVLASLASWNPADQDLHDWLSEQLTTDHPALAAAAPVSGEHTQIGALLRAKLILPVLDGLDEIPDEVRGPAIARINEALRRPGEQLILTCRSKQFKDAVRPPGGAVVTVRAGAVVQLCPLAADAVRGYLRDAAAGPAARARWDPVLAVLGTEAPAGQALRTPLMVGLACAIYNPRPGELAGALRDPAELCSPALADQTAVESLLFDAFIPAAYRDDHPAGRRKAQKAEKWLIFLARHIERTRSDLAWWQLPLAGPGFILVARLVVGAAVGVGYGAAVGAGLGALYGAGWGSVYSVVFGADHSMGSGAVVGAGYGAVVGAALGAIFGVLDGVSVAMGWSPDAYFLGTLGKGLRFLGSGSAATGWSPTPVRIRWQPPSRQNVVHGVVSGVAAGIVVVVGIVPKVGAVFRVPTWLVSWIVSVIGSGASSATVVGTVVGVAVGFIEWATHQKIDQLDLSAVASPPAVLSRDRRFATALGALFGAGAGILAGILAGIWVGAGVEIGTGVGILVGAISSFTLAAWPCYEFARIWFALRRQLPWRLMSFLSDAHRRGVLRQAGAVYQFRHIELQHRLATREANEQQGNSSTA